ncbi:polysaccharide deacetylase family protein [Halobacillus yeomjeoni]|uniref:Polysaccharide deacetylase family protein n=1 Tax=Halobacillus yeomjeoni TaxID=311194 RepID=A0A931HWG3_9BACI|nr:polysaccharide deacetylase family protein [Halobacillus yeomjeoni]MBH0230456.1 polysaccharide deacetylase family protein [Halobacillus yeomjeoni]
MRQPIMYISIISLVLLAACSFLASANGTTVSQEVKEYSEYDLDMKSEILEFEEYHITIHYPETPNTQINQTIIDYVNQIKSKFKQESYQAMQVMKSHSSHELHVDFEVLHESEQYFVIHFDETMDVGYPDISKSRTIMNFKKENGQRLETEDLFNQEVDYLQALADLTNEKLEEEFGKEINQNSFLEKATAPLPSNYQNVAINSGGVTIFFRDGVQPEEISLKMDNINEFLHPEITVVENEALHEATPSIEGLKSININGEDVKRPHGENKKIALTFDDGPHPQKTLDILEVLERYDAKGTFFMLGKRVSYYPETAQEVVTEGHEIGNHTWNHPCLTRLSKDEVVRQIQATKEIIQHVTGEETTRVRLPFGENLSAPYYGTMEIVPWDVSVETWRKENPRQIADTFISEINDGDIVLLHDLEGSTPEVLDMILASLSYEGYEFVTLSQLEEK